jgi:hypothetical protein
MTSWTSRGFVFAATIAVASCGGSGDGLDANGRPVEEGDGNVAALTPDWASIQANVFTPICTRCHVGANAPQGLRLDSENSYGALVGVPSSEAPGVLRVRPGDPGGSYLVQKLEGRAAVGARMPLGEPALPEATIQVIRQWITDGAAPGASGLSAQFAVQSVSVAPTLVAVSLTRPVDPSLVNSDTVLVVPMPAVTGAAPPIAMRVDVSAYNDSLILISPTQPLRPGRYRLTLRGTGPLMLADMWASVLDGDRDGEPGGDATIDLVLGGGP